MNRNRWAGASRIRTCALIYPFRKRVLKKKGQKNPIGSHIFFGFVGPTLVLLHAGNDPASPIGVITRLVPLFPFNLQNYAYGMTKITLTKYVVVSFLCMLPGTVAYCLAGGALVSGRGEIKRTLLYLAGAAVFFVFVSLLPNWIRKRYNLKEMEVSSDK